MTTCGLHRNDPAARCGNARVGAAYAPDQCRLCWKYEHVQGYRDRVSGGTAGPATPAPDAPVRAAKPGRFALACSLRGGPTGEVVPCKVCGGRRDVTVYSCPVYGRCTTEYVSPGPDSPRWCRTCEGKCQMRWSYGVMTVPERRDAPLPRTLASLAAAGFDRPHLFVDGADDSASWRAEFGLDVTARFPKVRTGGNWALSLGELYARDPEAERYALFQDDFVTVRGLRAYLEAVGYPARGYLNLMAFPQNERLCADRPPGFHPSNQRGLGAVALVFNREAAQLVLSHPHLVRRFAAVHARHAGWRSIDGGIVESFKQAGWREFVHVPSLVRHTGAASSMGNLPHPASTTFPGEGFDALTLLKTGAPA